MVLTKRLFLASAFAAVSTPVSTGLMAQAWPAKSIRMIVPLAPGATADIVARLFADELGKALGQTIVVDNKTGAGGFIALKAVAQAPADGYTLFLGGVGSLAVNPQVMGKSPYDPFKDFAPIILLASAPSVVAVNLAQPFKTIQEMTAYAKANPEKVSMGTAGAGQLSHLAGELLGKMSGTKYTMVHYKGSGNGVADLISGQIMMSFGTAPGLIPHIKNGKMIPIAVSSAARIPALPQVPSIVELIPGYDLSNWFGIFAPGQTSKPVVDKLFQSILSKYFSKNSTGIFVLLHNQYQPNLSTCFSKKL